MITALLQELRSRGITISRDGGRLKIQAPAGAVTPQLRDRLTTHKHEMLRWLQDSAHSAELTLPTCIPDPANRYEPFPLSDMQLGFYMADDSYLEFHVRPHYYIEKNIDGLDARRYEAAWNKALTRHRGEIVVVQPSGQLTTVADPAPLRCKVLDLRSASADAVAHALDDVRAQMMRSELPLDRWPWVDLRVTMWREDGHERARIHYNHNNFFSDGYGTTRLLEEIESYYKDPNVELPPLTLTFRDAALSLDTLAQSAAGNAARIYWERRLDGLPGPPNLPVRQEKNRRCRSKLQRQEGFVPASTWSAFKAQAMHYGITPSNAVFSVYAEILAAWSNSRHFLLSNMMTRRLNIHPEIRDIVGNFASLYPLEVDFRESNRFVDRARNLQEQVICDAQHLQWGGMQIMQALNRRKSSLGTAAIPFVIGSGLFMERFERSDFSCLETSQVMLDHQFWELANGEFYYVWDLLEEFFPEGLIQSMWEGYRRLFDRLAQNGSAWEHRVFETTPASELDERRAMTPPYRPVPDLTLVDFLEQTVAISPDATALVSTAGALTFRKLDILSSRLAAALARAAEVRGRNVAIVADRGASLFKAVYGVLKAGAAYVPVDPSLPVDRRNYVLENCEAAAVYTEDKRTGMRDWPKNVPVLSIEKSETGEAFAGSQFDTRVRADELAYLIYTSGSTGRPKGVMIDHKGAVNTISDVNERFGVGPGDTLFGVSTFGFDLSVYDLFGGVAAGAALVYPEPNETLNPSHWLDEVEGRHVTVWNSAPPLALLLVEAAERRGVRLPHLRLVMLSGDWIPVDLPARIRKIGPNARVVSLGGATEASIWSICYEIGEVDPSWRSILYGYPMQNQPWHILDDCGRDAPNWTAGDLYIAGDGLARGYWKDDAQTAASFVQHPFTRERIYRTGDIGRYLPGGVIEFMGRKDSQVKIQGHRIELGEIESVLIAGGTVSAAVATVQSSAAGATQLVAYVVPAGGAQLDSGALREELAAKLPGYMVPKAIRFLERLPLTQNGKIDRKALPLIDERPTAPLTHIAREPADDIECRLLTLWRDVLRQSELTLTDDFFEMGGQSFEAVRIVGAIRDAFGVRISLGSIWQERSVERVASLIREGKTATKAECLVQLRAEGKHQQLFLVHPAGGHVMCYRGLAELLERPVVAFQAPDLDGHSGALDSIRSLAELYVREVEQTSVGPIFLGGWSSGALISFEMAAQLRRRGRRIAGIAMFDCPAPCPGEPIADRALLNWFIEDLALNPPVPEILEGIDVTESPRQQMAHIVSQLRTTGRNPGIEVNELTAIYGVFLGIVKASRVYAGAETDVDIFLVRATDGVVSEFKNHPGFDTPDWGWRRFTSGNIETAMWQGTHYTMLSDGLVTGLAGTIERWMQSRETLIR